MITCYFNAYHVASQLKKICFLICYKFHYKIYYKFIKQNIEYPKALENLGLRKF